MEMNGSLSEFRYRLMLKWMVLTGMAIYEFD